VDLLEVPQRKRTAGTYRRLARVMAELGWTVVRVRDLTRGGYLEQVRGWCRKPQLASCSLSSIHGVRNRDAGFKPDPGRTARDFREVPEATFSTNASLSRPRRAAPSPPLNRACPRPR